MSTLLQEKLAEGIIKNAKRKRPLNKKELMLSVGYGSITANKKSKEVLSNRGVLDALQEYGFDPDSAKRVVQSILNKETARDDVKLRAADMIFEVHGTYAPVKSVNINVDVKPSEAIKQLADELIELQQRRNNRGNGAISEPVGGTTTDKERGGDTDRVQEEEIPD